MSHCVSHWGYFISNRYIDMAGSKNVKQIPKKGHQSQPLVNDGEIGWDVNRQWSTMDVNGKIWEAFKFSMGSISFFQFISLRILSIDCCRLTNVCWAKSWAKAFSARDQKLPRGGRSETAKRSIDTNCPVLPSFITYMYYCGWTNHHQLVPRTSWYLYVILGILVKHCESMWRFPELEAYP